MINIREFLINSKDINEKFKITDYLFEKQFILIIKDILDKRIPFFDIIESILKSVILF